VARKQTLPDVLFTASVAPTGFGEQYGRDLERLGSNKYPIWGVGLQLSYPLGNRAAENDYIKSKLRVGQSKTQIRSLEESIANDVRTAARFVDSSYKQIDVTHRGRAYAEERLNAFMKKNAVGLATTKDVLDVENDLVTAKGNEVKALAAYNNAICQLWKVTGELLDRQGIKVSVSDADRLYETNK
jgi:outer membrane protein TolC